VKLSPKGHIIAKMVSNNRFQLKQDTVESGPSSAADTVSTVLRGVVAYVTRCSVDRSNQ
jgi:hypothetical protein